MEEPGEKLTDLASVRPIRSEQPVCRPCPTAPGHMRCIEHEQAMSVGIEACETDARSSRTTSRPFVGHINADLGRVIFSDGGEAVRRGHSLVHILDVTPCRIVIAVVVEFGKERIGCRVAVDQNICCGIGCATTEEVFR